MFKKFFIAAALVLCVGCNGVPVDDGKTDTAQTEEQGVAQDEITFTMEDLCLYGDPVDGVCPPIIWLGMDKNDIDPNNGYMSCFSDSDISYEDATAADGTSTQAVSFINYKGGTRKTVRTVKGICSTGEYTDLSNPSSTADEVIEKYGIDPEAEGIDTSAENYTVSLEFAENEDGSLKRLTAADDTRTEYIIRFVITDNYVTHIQMMHK